MFFIPRLALNLIKLVTEVFTLTLREFAYAAFESAVESAHKSTGVAKRLYQLAAAVSWFFTGLFSFTYLIGCLITSPAMTLYAISDQMKDWEIHILAHGLILLSLTLLIFSAYLVAIIFLAPILLPVTLSVFITPLLPLAILGFSGWVGAVIEVGLIIFTIMGLVFNMNPDGPGLFPSSKDSQASIWANEFNRIINEEQYQRNRFIHTRKQLGKNATNEQKIEIFEQCEKSKSSFFNTISANADILTVSECITLFKLHGYQPVTQSITSTPTSQSGGHTKLILIHPEESDFLSPNPSTQADSSKVPADLSKYDNTFGHVIFLLLKKLEEEEKEKEKEKKDNMNEAIELLTLIPNSIMDQLKANKNSNNVFRNLVNRYANKPTQELQSFLKKSFCRDHNNWLLLHVAEEIWLVLASHPRDQDEIDELKKIKPLLSLLSVDDLELLSQQADLQIRLFPYDDNAIFVLRHLPELFAYFGVELIKLHYNNQKFMNFIKKNNNLPLSELANKLIRKPKKATEEQQFALLKLYPYFTKDVQENINQAFPDINDSSKNNYTPFFTPSSKDSFKEEEAAKFKRIQLAKEYAQKNVDIYKEIGVTAAADSKKIRAALKKTAILHKNALGMNASKAEKEAFHLFTDCKKILSCIYARAAYDRAWSNRSVFKRMFS